MTIYQKLFLSVFGAAVFFTVTGMTAEMGSNVSAYAALLFLTFAAMTVYYAARLVSRIPDNSATKPGGRDDP